MIFPLKLKFSREIRVGCSKLPARAGFAESGDLMVELREAAGKVTDCNGKSCRTLATTRNPLNPGAVAINRLGPASARCSALIFMTSYQSTAARLLVQRSFESRSLSVFPLTISGIPCIN
jgi:hypothetical protein